MEPTAIIIPPPFYKKRLFLVFIFIVILVLIPLSFYLFKIYFLKAPVQTLPQQSTQASSEPTLKESGSPIAFDILKNPAIYQWTGSVEGTLTAKDQSSLIITTKDNHSITIPLDLNPNGTKFYSNKPGNDLRAKSLTLADITIGSQIRGDFFIVSGKKDVMRAGSFVVMEK